MKAIIPVAGKGSRISKDIDGIPKSTVPLLSGKPIIRNSVESMLKLGIDPVLCTGYEAGKIHDALRGLPVRYYHNPFFAVTNNIASLWFARDEFDGLDDILLLSGDLYYPSIFLERAKEITSDLAMYVDSSRIYDGDFYFHLDPDGFVGSYGPTVPVELRNYEYMGFTKISKSFSRRFADRMIKSVDQGNYQIYFEDVALSFNRDKSKKIDLIDVAGEFWREFDVYKDYQLILQYERDHGGNKR